MLLDELEWRPEYALGAPEIDAAHREIFRMARSLYFKSYEPGKRTRAARESLEFLKKYTLGHFAAEEIYMKEIGYPGIAAHKSEHERMRAVILPGLERDLAQDAYSAEAIDRFLEALRAWLHNHIIERDLEIGRRAVAKRGSGETA